MSSLPFLDKVIALPVTNKSIVLDNGAFSNQRLTTDPYFYGTVTLQNVTNGFLYWVAQASDHTHVLGSGTQSGSSDISILLAPGYTVPMAIDVYVRDPSSTTHNAPFATQQNFIQANSVGANIYVNSVTDSYRSTTDPSAYTGISINHATQTMTVSTAHTMQEIYDYVQYNLAQSANMPYANWYTTSNGTDFVSTYNITITAAVTGGGSINLGSKTMTISGGGSYDGTYVDATGRQVRLTLTGLISGSVVQIYNTTNSVEIYKNTVAATSLSLGYTYTANKAIRVRVRYVNGTTGYTPYENTGTITSSGFSLNVNQVTDAVYTANALDGSTVTEFSLTEGVVGIFIDDPDNLTSFQRLYNWYIYAISTSTFIDDQTNLVTANSTRDYIFDDTISIKNLDMSNPLYIYGANVKNTSGTNALVNATGGSIFIRGDYPAASAVEVRQEMDANSQIKKDTSLIPALL